MLLVPVEFKVLESDSVIESLVCMEQEFMEKIMAISVSESLEE